VALSGEAAIYVDGKPHAAVTGACIELPLGSVLEIDNASPDVPFSYLIVKAK
jgi:hypothetical protein